MATIVSKTINGYGPYLYHVSYDGGKHVWEELGPADEISDVQAIVNEKDLEPVDGEAGGTEANEHPAEGVPLSEITGFGEKTAADLTVRDVLQMDTDELEDQIDDWSKRQNPEQVIEELGRYARTQEELGNALAVAYAGVNRSEVKGEKAVANNDNTLAVMPEDPEVVDGIEYADIAGMTRFEHEEHGEMVRVVPDTDDPTPSYYAAELWDAVEAVGDPEVPVDAPLGSFS